jgi:hypothetical protein
MMHNSSLLFPDKSRGRCKKSWSPAEDAMLQKLVEVHGTTSWTKIAEGLSTRTGKQCRERYHNHLQPNIRKGDWTEEEDRIIVEMQAKLGNQWAKITKMLPGRTDNAVKNRWHAAMRSQGRSSYGEKRRNNTSNNTTHQSHPSVPVLPLANLGMLSGVDGFANHVNIHKDELDYLYGADTEDETERSQVGRRGVHHSKVEHSLSSRTEPPHGVGPDTARQMEGMNSDDAFRTSPRLMDFLCFPLSGVTDNANMLLSGRSNSDGSLGVSVDEDGEYDCADTSAPLIAAEGSPRDITSWLSAAQASPKFTDLVQDPFSKQCAYIYSPGRAPYSCAKGNENAPMKKHLQASQDGMNFSNLRKEKLNNNNINNNNDSSSGSLGRRKGRGRRTKRVTGNSSNNNNNNMSKDVEQWALRSTKYGITNHNDSFTSTSSHSSGATSHENSDFDSQSSVSDTDYGELVDAGMIDLDEDVLAVNTNDPLAAFSKMEVSPRWELSPRLEYKRARTGRATPTVSGSSAIDDNVDCNRNRTESAPTPSTIYFGQKQSQSQSESQLQSSFAGTYPGHGGFYDSNTSSMKGIMTSPSFVDMGRELRDLFTNDVPVEIPTV